MTVIYKNIDTGAERHYGGRMPLLEKSDAWERVQDNEPAAIVVHGHLDSAGEADDEGQADDDTSSSSDADEWPRHKGGGTYELSDGETVRGKAAAIEAQEALDQ